MRRSIGLRGWCRGVRIRATWPGALTRMAVEDIGLADPQAQDVCLQSWQTYERLGSPEGELALAQAVTYLASGAKIECGLCGL